MMSVLLALLFSRRVYEDGEDEEVPSVKAFNSRQESTT